METDLANKRSRLGRFSSLSFIGVGQNVEASSQNQKYLKQAFFNAAANVFVILAVLALIAVFFVLEVFLRPLLWATLTGSFLYPFKKAATDLVLEWLNGLASTGTPLFIGIILVPFKFLNRFSDAVGFFVSEQLKLVLIFALLLILLYFLVFLTPFWLVISVFVKIPEFIYYGNVKIATFWQNYMLRSFWIFFFTYLCLKVFAPLSLSGTFMSGKVLNRIVWLLFGYQILMITTGISFVGVIGVMLLIIWGFFVSTDEEPVVETSTKSEEEHVNTSRSTSELGFHPAGESPEPTSKDQPESPAQGYEQKLSGLYTLVRGYAEKVFKPEHRSGLHKYRSSRLFKAQNAEFVDYSFYALFWVFIVITTLKNLWVLVFLLMPLAFFVLKRMVVLLKIDSFCLAYYKTVRGRLSNAEDVVLPSEMRRLYALYLAGDRRLVEALKTSVSVVMSVCFVLLLLLGFVFLSFFLAAQIQSEALGVVEIGTNLTAEMAASYPEFRRSGQVSEC